MIQSKNTGSALDAKAGNAFQSAYRNSDDLSPEQISAGFQARASSSAYQEMLVSYARLNATTKCSPRRNSNIANNSQLPSIAMRLCQYWRCLRYSSLAVKQDGKVAFTTFILTLSISLQRKIYAGACIYSRGSTGKGEALQDILHGAAANFCHLPRAASLERAWRACWCSRNA